MLNKIFIFLILILIFCVGVVLYFCFPQYFEVFVLRIYSPVADVVVTDNLLHDGGEYWEVVMDNNKPIGFQRTIIHNNYFEQQSRLILLRRGERFDVAMTSVSESDADGFFVSGKSITRASVDPIETNFRVQDDKLIISNSKNENSIAWKKTAGTDAVIKSLLKKPMSIGEERTITYFDPNQSQIVETKLTAKSLDSSSYHSGNVCALRIFVQSRVGDKLIFTGYYGVDRGGNIIYTEAIFVNKIITTLRTSQRRATAILSANELLECGGFGEIQLSNRIVSPRESASISFNVTINKCEPPDVKDMFAVSPFQQISAVSIGNGNVAIDITVWSSIDTDPANYSNKEYKLANNVNNNRNNSNDIFDNNEEWFDEYLASGGLINLDDPELWRLSDSVNSDGLTEWQTAVAMERLVSQKIKLSTLYFGFGTSSDVLRSLRGDCTEQAVLLTALCRKKGIPARVVIGLVYSEQQNTDQQNADESQNAKMIFHLWNEVYVAGIWRPLDATYGLGGADAARIKISDDSLKNDSIAALCRSILTALGQITTIEITSQ